MMLTCAINYTALKRVFEKKYQNRSKNFANAREIRNFFETAMMN